AAAALAFVLSASADAAQTDPEVIIYRFPGVFDDAGLDNLGISTVFHCTNFSGVTENVRFVTRGVSGTLQANFVVDILHLHTRTVSTHLTVAYFNDSDMGTGGVTQGTTAIAATSINVVCTAMTIDAANAKPAFAVSLRGIRFNPAPGSQE